MEKIDKRSKAYKDAQKAIVDNEISAVESLMEETPSEISELKDQVKQLTEMVTTMGKITANTANAVKDVKKAEKTPPVVGKIKHPRRDEFIILKKFLQDMAPHITHDKDLQYTLGYHMLYNRVEAPLQVIHKCEFLRDEALKSGLTKDFVTVIVPGKE